MKNYLIITISTMVLLMSCKDDSFNFKDKCFNNDRPPRNTNKVTIEQGIWGDVWYWKGDFMPISTGEICQVKRNVLIYELTTHDNVEQVDHSAFYSDIKSTLVKEVESDEVGFFQVELEKGTYSLFIEEDGQYYSNSFSPEGIFLVEVEDGKISEVRFDITYEATF